jgi:hypothetical protein
VTVVDAVKRHNSPGPAILEVARAVDELIARVDALGEATPGDLWGGADPGLWGDHDTHVEVNREFAKAEVRERLDALKDAAKGLSGDDLAANLAQQRLVEDELRDVRTVEPIPDDAPEEKVLGPGETEIALPVVDGGTQAARREFAVETLKIRDQYPHNPEFVEAYGKGGPLLFYYTDRDWVMSLPVTARQAMVEDVMATNPETAKKMGADILKRTDDESDTTLAQVALDAVAASGGAG